jgi:hypothetical protein
MEKILISLSINIRFFHPVLRSYAKCFSHYFWTIVRLKCVKLKQEYTKKITNLSSSPSVLKHLFTFPLSTLEYSAIYRYKSQVSILCCTVTRCKRWADHLVRFGLNITIYIYIYIYIGSGTEGKRLRAQMYKYIFNMVSRIIMRLHEFVSWKHGFIKFLLFWLAEDFWRMTLIYVVS